VADQRAKGQDSQMIMVLNGAPQATITDIVSAEITWMFQMKQQGYNGETSDRYDEVFLGMSGKLELHLENQQIFNLIKAVQDRAQRRLPGNVINLKTTLNFPNGDRPRILIPALYFGNMPMSFPGRTEYIVLPLEFNAAQAVTIF
jgi:hypothetical protein